MLEYVEKNKLSDIFPIGDGGFATLSYEEHVIVEIKTQKWSSLFNLNSNPFSFFGFMADVKIENPKTITVIESSDIISYQEKNNIIFRLFLKTSKPIILENASHAIPYNIESKQAYYLFMRGSNLHKVSILFKKMDTIALGKTSCVCKNTSFVFFNKLFSCVVIGTHEKKIIIYSIPSFDTVLESDLPEDLALHGPSDLIVLNDAMHILLFKREDRIILYFIEKEKQILFKFSKNEKPTRYSIALVTTEIFILSCPNNFIAIIDVCSGIDFIYSTSSYLTSSDLDCDIIAFPRNKNLVYVPSSFAFMQRKIDWLKLQFLLTKDSTKIWQFIAHIITHNELYNYSEDIFKAAVEANNPFNLSIFVSEFFISNVYLLVKENRESNPLLEFVPKRLLYSDENTVSEAKLRRAVEELVLSSEEKDDDIPISLIVNSYDDAYSPQGFSTVSTTYLLLLLAFNSKSPKQKLPPPICTSYTPSITFTSLSNEGKKLLKDIPEKEIKNFAIEYITKQASCAENFPRPVFRDPFFDLMRGAAIFHSAKHEHLPIAREEFIKLGENVNKKFPLIGAMFLARNGIIQYYGANHSQNMALWVRSPFAKTQIVMKPDIPTPFTLLPLSKTKVKDDSLFEPLSRTIAASEQFGLTLSDETISKYSYDNLKSIYGTY